MWRRLLTSHTHAPLSIRRGFVLVAQTSIPREPQPLGPRIEEGGEECLPILDRRASDIRRYTLLRLLELIPIEAHRHLGAVA